MQKNVGKIDRVIRVVLGLVLLSFVVMQPHYLWGLVGIIPLVTGLWGFCPLYKLIGLSSCPLSKN